MTVKKTLNLLTGDSRLIIRDPIFLVLIVAPFLIAAVLRFLIPLVGELIMKYLSFDLAPHYPFLLSLFSTVPALLVGMILGFILLDERDQDLITYFTVTPLGRGGYLVYRLAVPQVLSIALAAVMLLVITAGVVQFPIWPSLGIVAMASLQAPMMVLYLGAFAANKVEGMVYAKAFGLLFAGPIAGYLIPGRPKYLAGIIPPFWVTEAYLAALRNAWGEYVVCLVMGIITHAALMTFLFHRFRQKIK